MFVRNEQASLGEGYIPLSFFDTLALVLTQLVTLTGITAILGIMVSENLLKLIITSPTGTMGATFAGRTIVSNLLKLMACAGISIDGTISDITAATLTAALGEAYIVFMKMIANGEITKKI